MRDLTLIVNYEEYPADVLLDLAAVSEVVVSRAQSAAELRLEIQLHRPTVLLCGLGWRISSEIIGTATHLRAIASPTTALDHIDLAAARARDISVLSLRDVGAGLTSVFSTAELTWLLILQVARRFAQLSDSRSSLRARDARVLGRELNGLRLGVLGFGRIGRRVAEIGRAVGMSVVGCDSSAEARRCSEFRILPRESLEEFLCQVDVLSVHVTASDENRCLVTEQELLLLPPNAMVINTARGFIIDEEALALRLRGEHLFGVGVDVLSGELSDDVNGESPLARARRDGYNVAITPHVGGATVEATAKTKRLIVRELIELIGRRAS